MKKQLKAAKKVAALKKALKKADSYQREEILKKLSIAKRYLKKVAAKAAATRPKPIRARIAALKAKLARAKNPVRRALLKKQLKLAKKVAALKKSLRNARGEARQEIKARLLSVRK